MSDNCFGENKKKAVAMCLFYILHECLWLKWINHKKTRQGFLGCVRRGHTHMEADNMHALIARKQNKTKLSP